MSFREHRPRQAAAQGKIPRGASLSERSHTGAVPVFVVTPARSCDQSAPEGYGTAATTARLRSLTAGPQAGCGRHDGAVGVNAPTDRRPTISGSAGQEARPGERGTPRAGARRGEYRPCT